MTKSKSKKRSVVNHPEIVIQARYSSAIGIDVHLELLVCCYQCCHDHQIETEIIQFGTTASQLQQFSQWCWAKQPEIIVMESTGILWISSYEALEDVGFTQDQLTLVNARDVKATIGRKTDREDAKRLAELARLGNIKRSMIPAREFRQMRQLARRYQKLKSLATTMGNGYRKLLNSVGCRASTVFSDLRGMAASKILEAKIRNEPDLIRIVQINSRRVRASSKEILDALDFPIPEVLRAQLLAEMESIKSIESMAQTTLNRLKEMQKNYEPQIKLLMSIPGIKETSARLIFAELCDDLKRHFQDVEHFTSWMGICPGNNISAEISHSGKSSKGNKWIRRTLTECANTLRNRKDRIRDRFMAFKIRRGNKRAVIAMAHYLARVIYAILTKKVAYIESATTILRDVLVSRVLKNVKQLSKQGLELYCNQVIEKETGVIVTQG